MTSLQPVPLTDAFEEHRPRLRALAIRLLGAPADADDVLQVAWLRAAGSQARVETTGAWLTTIVVRLALNRLRDRRRQGEEPLLSDPSGTGEDPESTVLAGDAVSRALLIVMDRLSPAERVAFVLHDLFGIDFEMIATMLDRSPAAARQLASRGRRKVAAASPDAPSVRVPAEHLSVVDAFLRASRGGDATAFLAHLHPDLAFGADDAARAWGAPGEDADRDAVARFLFGRAGGARTAIVDGAAGAVWTVDGRVLALFRFTVVDATIVGIRLHADVRTIARACVAIAG